MNHATRFLVDALVHYGAYLLQRLEEMEKIEARVKVLEECVKPKEAE